MTDHSISGKTRLKGLKSVDMDRDQGVNSRDFSGSGDPGAGLADSYASRLCNDFQSYCIFISPYYQLQLIAVLKLAICDQKDNRKKHN